MKRISKRIERVTIKRMTDDIPDTSYLGEYSDRAESEYAIDRRHSLDCPVNSGTDDKLLWFTSGSGRIELQMTMEQAVSASHSGDCEDDTRELSKVSVIAEQLAKIDPTTLSAELKEYGAWDAEELADHDQNIQRILWLAACDIAEQGGCDCGERGDADRNEYRYFNPYHERYKGENPADIRKYCQQDYERMESLNRGNWCFIGIRADAEIVVDGVRQDISSGGLWGIESDSDRAYLTEIDGEQLSELRDQLQALGFGTRAISAAFKNVTE
jgi:hypothetical protein